MNTTIDYNQVLKQAETIKCPDPECGSIQFLATIKFKRVSALMSGTGKEELVPVNGPVLCFKCSRPLTDKDFSHAEETSEENKNEEEST